MVCYQRRKATVVIIIFLLAILLFSLYSFPEIAHSQQNSIIPDATLGTQVDVQFQGDLTNYLISDGTVIGGRNQFHSFEKFNVDTAETAIFTGPASIENILSRVTGGTQSWIDGLIKSDIQGANLFFLNPNGMLFGPNASLDVSGSFHASSADYLRLGAGEGVFYANPIVGDILTVDAPSAFGFLDDNPSGISIQESVLEVPEGETISLVGGGISITSHGIWGREDDNLLAPSGRINIASVASKGEVVPNPAAETSFLRVDSFESLGNVEIGGNAVINGCGNPGGSVFIRGGRFVMGLSLIDTGTYGELDHPGVGIDIDVTGDISIGGGHYVRGAINSSSHGAGKAGDIRISANSIQMMGDPLNDFASNIASRVFDAGNGGNIDITTQSIEINNNAGIVAQVFGSGSGGNITIATGDLQLSGDLGLSFISTSTFNSGDAGTLTVNSENVSLMGSSQGGFCGLATQVAADAFGGANAGDLFLTTGSLEILDGAQISASVNSSSGQAGSIEVRTDTLRIAGIDPTWHSAGIFSSTEVKQSTREHTTGNGGYIHIEADELQLADRGVIDTFSSSLGDSGDIDLHVGSLDISGGGLLNTRNYGEGRGGKIEVSADSVVLSGPTPQYYERSGISSIGGIFACGAGDITVSTGSLSVLDGAQISSSTYGPGHGGSINVFADDILIRGVDSLSDSPDGTNAGLFASTTVYLDYVENATGNAGDIHVQAAALELRDHSEINALSSSAGEGGSISIESNVLSCSDNSSVSTAAEQSKGGDISVEALQVNLASNSIISAESRGAGDGGVISICANELFQSDNSLVSTAAKQAKGGDIAIAAQQVNLTNTALVSAESSGAGDAGDIYINFVDEFLIENGSMTTEAAQADGGNIEITTEYMVRLVDSEISASVGGGSETVGGNIFIDPNYVIMDNSMIIANAYEGMGGNIDIVSDVFLADPESIVDASSDLGIDGQVDICAPIKNATQVLVPLQKDFRSAARLLRKPCMARVRGGKYSSFVIRGRDGLPLEPGGLLPSSLILK